MRGIGERLRLVVRKMRDHDLELDCETVTALAVAADVYARADARVGELDLLRSGDGLQCAMEARRIPGREQRLGDEAAAGPPISTGTLRSASSCPSAVATCPPGPSPVASASAV